ncbi:hypothetical protein MVEN_00776000 [Mycena venus]|uniref:Uncharacterized protein n=1 Tax=Mycena venus TaxID=2733690 RepID=A0A8H6YLI9_9AGAR|nr:hypothetical protein MVEN_00776000 [Mycena venus]
MSAFAFTYGSFGDILATGQLVAKVIVLLRNGRRSSECAETEKELKSLGTDLENITHIPLDQAHQSSPITPLSIAARIGDEVHRCHLIILRFFQKINASGNCFMHKLLMRVIERRTALSVVVGMMNSGTLLAVQDRVNKVGIGNTQIQEDVSNLAQQLATYQQQIVAVVRNVSYGVPGEAFVVVSSAGVPIPIPLVYCSTYDKYFTRKLKRAHI